MFGGWKILQFCFILGSLSECRSFAVFAQSCNAAAASVFCNCIFGHAKLRIVGVALEKPRLDCGITLTSAVSLCNIKHLVKLGKLVRDLAGVLIFADEPTHIIIGQILVPILTEILLEDFDFQMEVSVITTNRLKLLIFIGGRIGSFLLKSGADDDLAVLIVNRNGLHNVFLLSCPIDLGDLGDCLYCCSFIDIQNLLAEVLALLLDFRELIEEPTLDLEEVLCLVVLTVLVDGLLADECEGHFLLIAAVLQNIRSDGVHVQVCEISFVLFALDFYDFEVGVVAADRLKHVIFAGAVVHSGLHLGLGQLDGLVGQIGLHI